jgi:dihydroorotase
MFPSWSSGLNRKIELPRPDDFHVHLRQGDRLLDYARREAACFGRALVMPNTLPPIADSLELARYRNNILQGSGAGFEPLMAFKLLPGMSAATVRDCAAAGAIAGKYYPAGSTTNAQDGITDPAGIAEALAAMEELGLVLSIHGELPQAPVLDREAAFLPIVEGLLSAYPRLRIVLEHLSGAEALAFVLAGPPRLAGSLTAHHLLLSLDDLLGEALDPHLFCKPPLKTRRDRDALREAVFHGEGKLFFGSDSAPHPRQAKEGRRAPAGIYSAPTALCALVGLFVDAGAEAQLRPFFCERGASFYRLSPAQGQIQLSERPWTVPEEVDGSVPLLAGKNLAWQVDASL